MLKDITLGQYFPGNSLLHRLDPRMKIILGIVYIVYIFLAKNIFSFAFVFLFTIAMILVSGISLRLIIKGMKPLIFILLFTAFFNIFWTEGETPLIKWFFITIYPEGIMYALLMVARVIALLAGTCVILTYTTSPIALADGLERLLSPLNRIKVPVHDFSMMMTIALRFIPTLIEETDKIMNAQRARGVDFSNGSIKKRISALFPILIPLFVSAYHRAEDLAVAMECRCYRGGVGKTRMTETKFGAADFLTLLVMTAACVVVLAINRYAPGFKI